MHRDGTKKTDYSIPLQKPGRAQPGRKVGNATVPHPRIKPNIQGSQPEGRNPEYLRARAKHYATPTWAEEDIPEDGVRLSALPSTDLEEDRVYLVRCLNTGQLEALELYNDGKENVDIHRAETTETLVTNTPIPRKEPIGKQTKHTNSQKLAEEASKGKPELSFEEIVPKEYWDYRKVFEG
ncbi:hypothetical protein HETIRDRAFT_120454 [Heterobasidion irregulare TC 32-1]|uniref:Uncharacterized protein n=1 Tax=Heterobasidion irregulare (strain TC 32-1) TaxID=747525 RepID=W4JPM0_HETIT|nr:uncharacterized protein HETIRDRAFT_120454 [Heterobasidion irregulare TC 32-1]ETW75035.1 hypothetical protein HETIRDRAFT_120454 [Heterobasidion irregulare TC 32-1]